MRNIFILTGNLCSGKSTLLNSLKSNRVFTLDADSIVHYLLSQKARKIIKKFPNLPPDNRGKIAEIIFSDTVILRAWERFIHKLVYREIYASLCQTKKKSIGILDIPLFFESKHRFKLKHTVILVKSLYKDCLNRAKKKGIKYAEKRLFRQFRFQESLPKSDIVVYNYSTESDLLTTAKLLKTMIGL